MCTPRRSSILTGGRRTVGSGDRTQRRILSLPNIVGDTGFAASCESEVLLVERPTDTTDDIKRRRPLLCAGRVRLRRQRGMYGIRCAASYTVGSNAGVTDMTRSISLQRRRPPHPTLRTPLFMNLFGLMNLMRPTARLGHRRGSRLRSACQTQENLSIFDRPSRPA